MFSFLKIEVYFKDILIKIEGEAFMTFIQNQLKNLHAHYWFLAVFAICAGALIMAFSLENFGGIMPCQFCIYERYPYMVAGIIALIAIVINQKSMDPLWMVMCFLCFVIGFGVSLYHVLIEHHLIEIPQTCSAGSYEGSFMALKKGLLKVKKLARCDQVPMKILNLSLVEHNALLSFAMICLSGFGVANLWESYKNGKS